MIKGINIVTERNEMGNGKTPAGHRIRHDTQTFGMVLIPLPDRPFPPATVDKCPTCQVKHYCKTIHIHLDAGVAIISQGVLESILRTSMLEDHGFTYDQVVLNPPPLNLARGRSRAEIDHRNRAIAVLGQTRKGKKNG